MKSQIKCLLAVAILAASIGCTRVSPGYVGIKVINGGTDRGVQDYPAQVGWVWYNPISSSILTYPTFVQTAIWTQNPNEGDSDCNKCNEEITFTNKDQMQISADISLAYHLDPEKVPHFYVKFRNDNIRHFTHGMLRNMARDEFDRHGGSYEISQIMGDNAKFLDDVRSSLQKRLDDFGVKLDQFGFIGAPRPPQAVIDAINSKVHATQLAMQKTNELLQSTADANKRVADAEGDARAVLARAHAEAEANQLVAKSLTPELIQWRTNSKWDGRLPQVTGGGTLPMINLSK